jgi:cell division protein FtsB
MNQVRDCDERVFHLTAGDAKSVLRNAMNRSVTGRRDERQPGAFVRLYERAQVGWRRFATGAAALLALGMGYHVIFGQNGLTAYQQKRQEARALDNQLHSLQRENDLLKGHVDRLQSDPNAIEHQAREELHYTRPGEVIYTLPAAPPSKDSMSQNPGAKH